MPPLFYDVSTPTLVLNSIIHAYIQHRKICSGKSPLSSLRSFLNFGIQDIVFNLHQLFTIPNILPPCVILVQLLQAWMTPAIRDELATTVFASFMPLRGGTTEQPSVQSQDNESFP